MRPTSCARVVRRHDLPNLAYPSRMDDSAVALLPERCHTALARAVSEWTRAAHVCQLARDARQEARRVRLVCECEFARMRFVESVRETISAL